MKITKLGHCCLIIEHIGGRILTDPGDYTTTQQSEVKDIDAVLITHEHPDHLHIESVKTLVQNNPQAKVFTNAAVGKLLDEAGIEHTLIKDKDNTSIAGIGVEAFEVAHAVIYKGLPRVRNTGFFFDNRFFYPGDALTDPKKPVEILALPVAGPWLTISDAVDYALKLKPKHAFPVHDGLLKRPQMVHRTSTRVLVPKGVNFEVIEDGQSKEY